MKLFQSIIAGIVLLFMLVSSMSTVFADSTEGTWYHEGKAYLYGTMQNVFEKKTKETNEISYGFECYEVWPTSGWIDTYSKMQISVVNAAASRKISDTIVVKEHTGFFWFDLNEGYEAGDQLRLRVRGNDPKKEAYASFSYNPM